MRQSRPTVDHPLVLVRAESEASHCACLTLMATAGVAIPSC